ncbi:MAG: 50S ribosomal protein L18 [Alphaproteobacteria bacterium]|nr:50S ribosomal protein L18 [Alphaproteobacteria bacterium]
MNKSDIKFERRKARVRYGLKKNASDKLRLSVYRSEKNISVQIIDDKAGKTLLSASSLNKEITEKGSTVAGAVAVGKLIAERAAKAGISEVVFDRGGYIYHGRVKALADAAREAGLKF